MRLRYLTAFFLLVGACTGTTTPTPTPVSSTGIPPSAIPFASAIASSAVAVSPDGTLVASVNPDSDSVTLVATATLSVLGEVAVGDDPRTLVFTPDSRHVIVTNHGDASLSAIDTASLSEVTRWRTGQQPYGVVTDGRRAYVAELALDTVAVLDLESGEMVSRVVVDGFPAGLGLYDGGSTLLVTHLFSGKVTAIDTASLTISDVQATGIDTNLFQSLAFHPDGQRAFLPQTRSNVTNRALVFDATVFPIVNVIALPRLRTDIRSRITLDTADQPVNMPFAVAITPDGRVAYVVNAGSNDVSVIDLESGQGIAHVEVGANPRGLAITEDGSRVFVNNTLDGTLSVIDTATNLVTATVVTTVIPLAPQVLAGKRLFNSSEAP
ncbi:MAG: beta-propeller fold lactonase family protein, partial [Gemmatimonadales bacterium]